MHRVILQPAFILHSRPYSDTGLLLDVFSQDYGRVHLLARGARNAKGRGGRILQPFSPLLLSWQGRTDLMTLSQSEPQGLPCQLTGDALLCAFYINEVLVRVIQRGDPCPQLYKIYEATLQYLAQSVNISSVLRLFEKHLLTELGYALSLTHDLDGAPIDTKKTYSFIPAVGFKCHTTIATNNNHHFFSGECLLALHTEQFPTQEVLRELKRLMQLALAPLIGEKPLKSRECFV